ncbi:hypothetical protein NDU88_002078 [Pleurodeles waltl]|uniref:Uncharacterized protein n=1 Tax=Pleurodeles waltl TaxID=8319 RepID=A0AAV7S985_PLEWA|nr:hypothetical protein NDU88_002078 [Pleurodeles waltl]
MADFSRPPSQGDKKWVNQGVKGCFPPHLPARPPAATHLGIRNVHVRHAAGAGPARQARAVYRSPGPGPASECGPQLHRFIRNIFREELGDRRPLKRR